MPALINNHNGDKISTIKLIINRDLPPSIKYDPNFSDLTHLNKSNQTIQDDYK